MGKLRPKLRQCLHGHLAGECGTRTITGLRLSPQAQGWGFSFSSVLRMGGLVWPWGEVPKPVVMRFILTHCLILAHPSLRLCFPPWKTRVRPSPAASQAMRRVT